MKKYDTCIILVNFNNISDTKECLQSIKNTSGPLPFVVVVDNASNNQKDIESELFFFPHLKLILNTENIGFGKANNLGISWVFKNILSNYVFILNNDTIIEKSTIPLMVKYFLTKDASIGLIVPKILIYNSPQEIWYKGADIDFKKITPSTSPPVNPSNPIFASGCAMFFSYNVLKEIKGFDPYFFMYDEDVELCLRINKIGIKIAYFPDATIYHKCQGSQTKEKNIPSNQLHPKHPSLMFYLKNTIPNRKYIIKKHLSGISKTKTTFFHTSYWLLKSIQFFIFGNFKASFKVIKLLFI
jgi:GT2 family glycosyltransferase